MLKTIYIRPNSLANVVTEVRVRAIDAYLYIPYILYIQKYRKHNT